MATAKTKSFDTTLTKQPICPHCGLVAGITRGGGIIQPAEKSKEGEAMRIKGVKHERSNDFAAVMVCEHCGHEALNDRGYHDNHYHTLVIPRMGCPACHLDRAGNPAESFHPGCIAAKDEPPQMTHDEIIAETMIRR